MLTVIHWESREIMDQRIYLFSLEIATSGRNMHRVLRKSDT